MPLGKGDDLEYIAAFFPKGHLLLETNSLGDGPGSGQAQLSAVKMHRLCHGNDIFTAPGTDCAGCLNPQWLKSMCLRIVLRSIRLRVLFHG